MSAQLDFPPIAESAPALTVAAPAQPAAADLAKIDLQAVALAQFGDWRKDVDAAKKKLTDVVLDLATQSKVDEAKSLRHRTVNTPIAEVRKVSKALKSKLAGVSKAIGAEEEAAVAAWTAVGELLTPQIDARQAQLDEERAVKAQGEAFRKALHMALIERIKGYVEQATGLPSERIGAGVTFVQGLTFGNECQEFLPQYRAAHAAALAALIAMRDDAKVREDAEAQRLENERVAAELAAQKQALEDQAAELLRQRVAITHAAVFSFPEVTVIRNHPNGTPMFSTTVFKESGDPIMLDEHGKRSVFCDLNDDIEEQPTQQVLKAEPVTADATDRVVAATASPSVGSMGEGQPADAGPAGGSLVAQNNAAREQVNAMAEPAQSDAQATGALLSTGAVCEQYGFTMTTDFIRARGLRPVPNPAAKSGTYWTEHEPVRLASDRRGRVYVAGPMTGLPDLNFPAFNAEAARLRSEGLTVINPAEHGIVEGAEWGDYLRHDLAGLVSCERIHLLPGWSKSKGANLEVLTALMLGVSVTLANGAEQVDPAAVLAFFAKSLGVSGFASPLVVALAAVTHAVEACKDASGRRIVIDTFVNKASLAHEAVEAVNAGGVKS